MFNRNKAKKSAEKPKVGNLPKVLLVEDDPMISELLEKKFSMSELETQVVTNSTQAISKAEQFLPNIVILDLMMTPVTGEEVLKKLKAHEDLKDIPVLVFSNKAGAEDMQHVIELGAAKFLVKADTELSQLVEEVKKLAKK